MAKFKVISKGKGLITLERVEDKKALSIGWSKSPILFSRLSNAAEGAEVEVDNVHTNPETQRLYAGEQTMSKVVNKETGEVTTYLDVMKTVSALNRMQKEERILELQLGMAEKASKG